MIVKGRSRGDGGQLAAYLLHSRDNDTVIVLETAIGMDTPEDGVFASLEHADAMAALSKGWKGHYHAQISPDRGRIMTLDQFHTAVEILAEAHGYAHAPRVVVLHEKGGHVHGHVVFQRAMERDDGLIVLRSDSNNFEKNERAARKMEKVFGHELVRGAFHEDYDLENDRPVERERGTPRPGYEVEDGKVTNRRVPDHEAMQRQQRTGKEAAAIKAELTALWTAHEDGQSFAAALAQSGYRLARGDKKDILMVVDRDGEAHDLRRSIKGLRKKDLEARLQDDAAETLQPVAAVRETVRAQARQQAHERDQLEGWDARAGRESRLQEAFRETANDNRENAAADERARAMEAEAQERLRGWDARMEDSVYDREAQTMAQDERLELAALDHAREEDERRAAARLERERQGIIANRARAELQSRHLEEAGTFGRSQSEARERHRDDLKATYSDGLREDRKREKALRERLATAGWFYRWRHAANDRAELESLRKTIANGMGRVREIDGAFKAKQAEAKTAFAARQAEERRRTEQWLEQQMMQRESAQARQERTGEPLPPWRGIDQERIATAKADERQRAQPPPEPERQAPEPRHQPPPTQERQPRRFAAPSQEQAANDRTEAQREARSRAAAAIARRNAERQARDKGRDGPGLGR